MTMDSDDKKWIGRPPIAKRVREFRGALRMEREDFANSIGVGDSAVGNWESGNTGIERKNIMKMVDVHGLNSDWLRSGKGEMMVRSTQPRGRAEDGDGTLPVYTTETIEGGAFVVKQLLERINTPSPLIGRAGAYGLFISGSGMAPAFRYGDTVFVDPLLPPIDLTEVVLVRAERHEGEEVKLICTLISFDEENWTVSTSAAGLTTHRAVMSRVEWPKCHRIVGKFSRR